MYKCKRWLQLSMNLVKYGALEPFEEHPTYSSIRIKRQKESKAAIGNFSILRQIWLKAGTFRVGLDVMVIQIFFALQNWQPLLRPCKWITGDQLLKMNSVIKVKPFLLIKKPSISSHSNACILFGSKTNCIA